MAHTSTGAQPTASIAARTLWGSAFPLAVRL